MTPTTAAYLTLGLAILLEVTGSSFLQKSEQFTRLAPSLLVIACYAVSFYAMSHALKAMPLGIAYALWAGLGIVLTALVSVIVFRQMIDLAGFLGIGLIVSGVVVISLFSRTTGH
ncbi:DMT family transporter [Pseudogemmobacter sonorensis]|uniref:DMT family transporter n=1 Tax=Pseudogemmobacter sonorensis TaxID=2989681 RepID=UPI00367842A5